MEGFTFKIASEPREIDQIHRLNHRTFVKEIPQHLDDKTGILVDKYHNENTYIICLEGDKLCGMVALRDKRPFSLDTKLDNLDSYLPAVNSPCEIRLLAVEHDRRHSLIFRGLISGIAEYCEDKVYDLVLISGTVRQLKLYRHLGFTSFGPLVGSDDAAYQPMYLTLEASNKLRAETRALKQDHRPQLLTAAPANFMPGPVAIASEVQRAYETKPVSHRSDQFMKDFADTKQKLCDLVNCREAAILTGAGTLANDAVAAQLSLLGAQGLILVNGEFGYRLVKHAEAAGLNYKTLIVKEGEEFSANKIQHPLGTDTAVKWLWSVHCETSTGVLNDLNMLKAVCKESEILLCMDCISSVGTVAVDLSDVYLATCVSGKSIGALPGLSMVLYNHKIKSASNKLLRCIDLGLYSEANGVPFTLSSNLLYALKAALEQRDWPSHFDKIKNWSCRIRREIQRMGYDEVSEASTRSRAVITIQLSTSISSEHFGRELSNRGFLLSYRSSYLLKSNWIQICLMGDLSEKQITSLIRALDGMSSFGVTGERVVI